MLSTDIATELLFGADQVDEQWLQRVDRARNGTPIRGAISAAETVVRQHYRRYPNARDGYSRLGFYLLSREEELGTALRLFDMDTSGGRQTWFQGLRHAECLATMGRLREAFAIVERVYAEHPKARNGYAAIAWRLQENRSRLGSPWDFAKKDLDAGRLTAGYMLNVAELAILEEHTCIAQDLIEHAYRLRPSLSDGYARSAWRHYWPRRDLRATIEWLMRDRDADRLTPRWQLRLAQALAADGRSRDAFRLVEHAYKSDASLSDGYARAAWELFRQADDTRSLIPWMEKDLAAGRLSPEWQANLAIAHAGGGDLFRAIALVDKAYAADPTLENAYSKCAWQRLWPARDYPQLIELMERDAAPNRLSPDWQINLAVAHAAKGDLGTALTIVDHAYTLDRNLTDGYARCAWHCLSDNDPDGKLLELMARDQEAGRLSARWQLNLAVAHAACGAFEKAVPLVEQAYCRDRSLTDGYARCAWHHFWPTRTLPQLIEWMERDLIEERMSPRWEIDLAVAHAAKGNLTKAVTLVQQAYDRDASVSDGYTRCAWHHFMPHNQLHSFMDHCKLDIERNRLSPTWRMKYAEALALDGALRSAERQVETAWSEDNTLNHGWHAVASRWIESRQFTLSPRFATCRELVRLAERGADAGAATDLADARVHAAIASSSSILAKTLAAASRFEVDIPAQWSRMAEATRIEDRRAPSVPFDFLNARLYCSSPGDLLTQFLEIVLHEQYHFRSRRARPVIIDAGANVGAALAYFKWLFPRSEIIAFEPNPTTFRICAQNIELNSWEGITLHPFALTAKEGYTEFVCSESMPMASSLTDRPRHIQKNARCSNVSVPTRRLSQFVRDTVEFLKMDIEGEEGKVIRELGTMLGNVDAGFIEYHYAQAGQTDTWNRLADILNSLESASLDCWVSAQPGAPETAIEGVPLRPSPPPSCSITFRRTDRVVFPEEQEKRAR